MLGTAQSGECNNDQTKSQSSWYYILLEGDKQQTNKQIMASALEKNKLGKICREYWGGDSILQIYIDS